MTIKIEIEWYFVSPTLQLVKGIVTIKKIYNIWDKNFIVLKCNVSKTNTSLSYTALKDFPLYTDKLNSFSSEIERMVNSYYHGVILDNLIYSWIIDSNSIDNNKFYSKRNG